MRKRTLSSQILRILGFVILLDLIVVLIIVAIGWQAGWQTPREFHRAIQYAGILVIGISFLGVKGNWKRTRPDDNKSSKSFAIKEDWVGLQPSLADYAQSYAFMIVMLLAGGLCLIIGWMV